MASTSKKSTENNGWRNLLSRWFRRDPAKSTATKSLGDLGELAAKKFLKKSGLKILSMQERSSFGEIDLIAVDGQTIVFVEVKSRRTHLAGHPAEAVNVPKQRRITRLALAYMKRHGLLETPARFDIIAVTWPADQKKPKIEHIRNAFQPIDRWQMYS